HAARSPRAGDNGASTFNRKSPVNPHSRWHRTSLLQNFISGKQRIDAPSQLFHPLTRTRGYRKDGSYRQRRARDFIANVNFANALPVVHACEDDTAALNAERDNGFEVL